MQLGDAGDVSELHLRAGDRSLDLFETALQTATPWSEHERVARNLSHETAWAECGELASERDILARLVAELEQAGLVGEQRTAKLLFLAVISRLLDKPVSVAIKGPSSAGKSNTLERVLELFPKSAFYEVTAMSERALVYSNEPLAHRMLVIYEATGMEGDFTSYLLRSLLSEGRVRYETVEKTPAGLQARLVERTGPTGLIVTTTAISLHPENETRLLSLPVTDTPDQTRRVLLSLAAEPPAMAIEPWHALQVWLANGSTEVVVPFAKALAELVPPVSIRLRRDFRLLLSLMRAHALLHRANRSTDRDGRVIATLEDYEQVRELVADLIAEGVEASVPATVRETVETVTCLTQTAPEGVSLASVAQALNLDKGPVSRRVRAAKGAGYLKNLEERRGHAATLNECGACGHDFCSLELFDRHRVGAHTYTYLEGLKLDPPRKSGRRCLTREEMGKRGWILDPRGRWSDPARSGRLNTYNEGFPDVGGRARTPQKQSTQSDRRFETTWPQNRHERPNV